MIENIKEKINKLLYKLIFITFNLPKITNIYCLKTKEYNNTI